jgi:hypothetical protein
MNHIGGSLSLFPILLLGEKESLAEPLLMENRALAEFRIGG